MACERAWSRHGLPIPDVLACGYGGVHCDRRLAGARPVTLKQRNELEAYLQHATEALAEARDYFSKTWVGQGHAALRELEEYLHGAVAALAKCR